MLDSWEDSQYRVQRKGESIGFGDSLSRLQILDSYVTLGKLLDFSVSVFSTVEWYPTVPTSERGCDGYPLFRNKVFQPSYYIA